MDTTKPIPVAVGDSSRTGILSPVAVAAAGAAAAAWTAALGEAAPNLAAGAAPATQIGLFPSLSTVRRLMEVLPGFMPQGFASMVPAALALVALATALFVWARRYETVRGGALLLLAVALPALLAPAVVSTIAQFPQLAISFLAGTMVLAALSRQMRGPSDIGLLTGALCIVGAWLVDDLFWAALPGCLLFLFARSPEAIRSRSAASLPAIVLFPVAAALVSLLFLACVHVYPKIGIVFATGFDAFVGVSANLGSHAPVMLLGAVALALGLNFALAALAPPRLPAAFAAAAPAFSTGLIGLGVAGMDGLLAALPMVAVSILETVRIMLAKEPETAPLAKAV